MKAGSIVVMAVIGYVGAILLLDGRRGSYVQTEANERVDVNGMRGGGFRVQDTGAGKDQASASQEAAERKVKEELARQGIVDRDAVDSAMDRSTTPTDFFTAGPAMGW